MLRAYEVVRATGRSLADWQEAPDPARDPGRDPGPGPGLRFRTLVLDPPREALYRACDARFGEMLAAGAVDEARRLAALGLDPDLPVMKAVGVAELLAHVRGEIALDEAAARARRATRRYAKRQVTWFRHQATGARRLGAQYSESLNEEIFSFVVRFVLTE